MKVPMVTTDRSRGLSRVKEPGCGARRHGALRSALGNIAGSVQAFFGGNISIYTDLCEHPRSEAFDLMLEHAQQMGANAVIGMRYDANDVMEGVTEVLAYGTAVVVQKV